MNIIKLSWSDKRRNHFVNFYAFQDDKSKTPVVLTMPFSMSAGDARQQYDADRYRRGVPPYSGPVLHICLDLASGRLYLPDMEDVKEIETDDQTRALLYAIRLQAEKLVGPLPMAPIISGDPLHTIRIKKIADFPSAAQFVAQHVKKGTAEQHLNLPVVEADLSVMPLTVSRLPEPEKAKMTQGTYVGKSAGPYVEFYARRGEKENQEDVFLASQKTPFILLNISKDAKTSAGDKERLVVTLHKEFFEESGESKATSPENKDVAAIKYLMYVGWSFKELCTWMLSEDNVANFRDLIYKGSYLYNAAKLLAKDGYADPSANPYYYSFAYTKEFPMSFRPGDPDRPLDVSGQPPIFQVMHFDPTTSMVTIKTPFYISEALAEKVLGVQGAFFASQYDPNTRSIKMASDPAAFAAAAHRSTRMIQNDVAAVHKLEKTAPFKEIAETEIFFERKKISDYPQASDIIRRLCRAMTTPEKTIRFDDLDVIVGPWTRVTGASGAYYDRKRMQAAGIAVPFELMPGFMVSPPIIAIDDAEQPNIADRTHIIVHEYRHHINSMLWVSDPREVTKEEVAKGDSEDEFLKYLDNKDERLAHKAQFKYLMGIGMSKEEILNQMLQDKVTASNIRIAKKYMEILNDAAKEMKEEEYQASVEKDVQKAMEENKFDSGSADEILFDPDELEL